MAGYYDRDDWEDPEIMEWRYGWGGDAGPGATRCFPFPILGGFGLGLGFAALGCRPRRRDCRPRVSFDYCQPRYGFGSPFSGCYPRSFGCYPA